MNEIKLSLLQVINMRHAIGLGRGDIKRSKYKAYRNAFYLYEPSDSWEELKEYGLVDSCTGPNKTICYFLTTNGFDFMSKLFDAEIEEEKF